MENSVKVSYVIPCYKSARTIGAVVEAITAAASHSGFTHEVILINDCSPDDTFAAIQSICQTDEHVTGLNLSRNFGQHSALMAGLNEAQGEFVVCLDDDGQTPPEESIKLIAALEKGADVAFARYGTKQHNALRNLGSRLNDFMATQLIRKPRALYLSSYVAIRRYVVDEIIRYSNPYPYLSGLLLRATGNIVNVDVEHRERQEGRSGYTMRKLISLWMNGFTNFSVKPLRVSTLLGCLLAVAGFLAGVYTVVNRFLNPDVPMGWSSTMAALLFVGGAILFMLGLVGEYIGRMYMSINQQPQYIVRDRIGPVRDDH